MWCGNHRGKNHLSKSKNGNDYSTRHPVGVSVGLQVLVKKSVSIVKDGYLQALAHF